MTISETMSVISRVGAEALCYGSSQGIVGALASIGMPLEDDYTYELIAYRSDDFAGRPRLVDKASVLKMNEQMWSVTFNNIDPETGEFNYEGELEFSNLSPFDVVVDGTKETWDNDWIMCRTFKNRYDLIVKYPELTDKILGIPPKNQSSVYRLAVFSNDDTDDIPVYEFFHRRTESMPDGRYLLSCHYFVVGWER
jgi:hypothetical protein